MELIICIKMDSALNNLQRLIYHKTQTSNQPFNGKPMKLVDKFIYLSSNISSTESDVSVCIDKVWTAIDKLMVI